MRHIGDVRLELVEPDAIATTAVREGLGPRGWATIACVGLLIAGITFGLTRPKTKPTLMRRFDITVPELAAGFGSYAAIDRTGTRIAYPADSKMWVRELSDPVPRAVTGSDNPQTPIWSPDGKVLAFTANKKLWKVPYAGGTPTLICDVPGTGEAFGGDWGEDGIIRFPVWRGSVYEVPASGGTPEVLMAVDPKKEVDVHSLKLLPDGKSFIYYLHSLKESESSTGVFADGKRYGLDVQGGVSVYSPEGYLFYEVLRGNSLSLWEVPFAWKERKVTGAPQLVAENAGAPQVADDGTLLYIDAPNVTSNLAWIDREGGSIAKLPIDHEYQGQPALSPDGSRLAFTASDAMNPYDIWEMNLTTGAVNRLTFSNRSQRIERRFPTWSAQGDQIAYSEMRNVSSSLFEVASDGSGDARKISDGLLVSFSPIGNLAAVSILDEAGNTRVEAKWLDGSNRSNTITQAGGIASAIDISPDGKFIAYTSDESGHNEVYVKGFPGGQGKWQISNSGGNHPRWSANGKELFFRIENTLFSVPVKLSPTFSFGTAQKLFTSPTVDLSEGYAAKKDGKRFIVVTEKQREAGAKLILTENWQPDKK